MGGVFGSSLRLESLGLWVSGFLYYVGLGFGVVGVVCCVVSSGGLERGWFLRL